MHERGKSDSPVVPAKPPNNAGRPAAEAVEERGLAKGNTEDPTRPGHSAGTDVSSGLDRVREIARQDRDARFTALLHHVDLARLRARSTWCKSAVNRASLSCRAISRTRSSPLDTSVPALCPGRVGSSVFPLASPLSSTASAAGRPALFGGFAGTTGLSDFPRSCISGLWTYLP